jgi:hypothetical protein
MNEQNLICNILFIKFTLMNTKAIPGLLLILFVTVFCSCSSKSNHKGKTVDQYVIGRDTCNLTDENGKRQGKWVPNYNNDLKDTVYYKGGDIVLKTN